MPDTPNPAEKLNLTFRVADTPKVAPPARGRWLVWCMIGAMLGIGGWQCSRWYLTRSLINQVTTAQSQDAALLALQSLDQLGNDAIGPLCGTLGHQDAQVARAAYRLLDARLTLWQKAPGDYADLLLSVASGLHDLPDSTIPQRLDLASSLATRIHVLCDGAPQFDLSAIITACNKFTERAHRAQFAPPSTASTLATTPADSVTGPDAQLASVSLGQIQSLAHSTNTAVPPPLGPAGVKIQLGDAEFTDIASGGTSFSLDDSPPAPIRTLADARHSSTGSPRATVQLEMRPTQPRGQGTRIASETAAAFTNDPASRAAEIWSAPAAARLASPMPAVGSIDVAQIPSMPVDQLVRLLGSPQPQVAQTAALSLKANGVDDSSVALASELAIASTKRKLELTAEIAVRDDLDPPSWLLWMAEDPTPAVRRQAVSLLSQMVSKRVAIELTSLLAREQDQTVAHTIRQVLAKSPGLPLR